MRCGKSLTGFWIAQNLRANSILIAVPSLALVKQTLETWTREAIANHIELRYMAVCSDAEVTQADDPAINKHEMGVGVTTDEEEICSFLRNKTQNLKLIITTYQSGRVWHRQHLELISVSTWEFLMKHTKQQAINLKHFQHCSTGHKFG